MTIFLTPPSTYSLEEAGDLRRACAEKLGIAPGDIQSLEYYKRSLDVRHKRPKFQAVLIIDVAPNPRLEAHLRSMGCVAPAPKIELPTFCGREPRPNVAIVGAGPSGLFAAMVLATAGCHVDIFERGKPVSQRTRDVATLMHHGRLNPESNICYGEGGAGTFSDGKLMTRTKSKYIPYVLERFRAFGADSRILYESHPHIGTDRLAPILTTMRGWLESRGTTYHFDRRVEAVWVKDGRCRGLVVAGERLGYDAVFLGMGHSADDMFEGLLAQGFALEAKPLAVGVRVEHPQALIDEIQYGRHAGHPLLPPAEYAVRFNAEGMASVFSFCMCPGGHVVASQTTAETRVVNGMSGSRRNGRYANAALVATVGAESFDPGPLGGLKWIRALERRAAEGMPPAHAPAQSVRDFLARKCPSRNPVTTYAPGTAPANLHDILPRRVAEALCAALPAFDRQMKGFLCAEANFIGIESRTSSPVRVVRGEDYEAVGIENAYPMGEGAGYAGGITSCALDGIHAALAWCHKANLCA